MGNSMIIKTAIALFLTASLAGSAVYFGTQNETDLTDEVRLGEHPHKTIDDQDVDAEEPLQSLSPELAEESVNSNSEETVIDRLLKRRSASDDTSSSSENESVEDAPNAGTTSITETTTTTITEIVEVPDDELDSNIEVIGEGEDSRIVSEAEDQMTTQDIDFLNLDKVDRTISVVMAQIENIETTEIKDQAYFDVVTYALRHKKYANAGTAISKIGNMDFRDTARGQYAVALAKDGKTDEAFALLEDLEVDELRDVLRLKVIEAMILPDETK